MAVLNNSLGAECPFSFLNLHINFILPNFTSRFNPNILKTKAERRIVVMKNFIRLVGNKDKQDDFIFNLAKVFYIHKANPTTPDTFSIAVYSQEQVTETKVFHIDFNLEDERDKYYENLVERLEAN